MSILFHTDNIFYVPKGRKFVLYDILRWRKIEIDILSMRTALNSRGAEDVRDQGKNALELADFAQIKSDLETEAPRLDRFLDALPFTDAFGESSRDIRNAFLPYQPRFWIHLSQEPMESFFPEDYEDTPAAEENGSIALSCVGAVHFNGLGDMACELPSEQPFSIHLLGPPGRKAVSAEVINPFEPLPLAREYCGHLGSSNQGNFVTINVKAAIPAECMAAIPIRRQGENYYETLYFHFTIEPGLSPLRPFAGKDSERILERLKECGYSAERRSRRFSVWRRDKDILQIYRNLPGKEFEGVPVLPPFCLAALAQGTADRAARLSLLVEIFNFPEH